MPSAQKITTSIGARVHRAISNEIEDLARKTGRSKSQILKEAIGFYLKHNDDVETPKPVNKVLENLDLYRQADAQDYFIEKENQRASIKLKELTFTEYMYKNVTAVYISNREHLADEELIEHMRASLEVLKRRAEHHDKKEIWQELYDNPKQNVEEYLDRKALEDKAFGDWIDQIDH